MAIKTRLLAKCLRFLISVARSSRERFEKEIVPVDNRDVNCLKDRVLGQCGLRYLIRWAGKGRFVIDGCTTPYKKEKNMKKETKKKQVFVESYVVPPEGTCRKH